jgi:hypothetical protein
MLLSLLSSAGPSIFWSEASASSSGTVDAATCNPDPDCANLSSVGTALDADGKLKDGDDICL